LIQDTPSISGYSNQTIWIGKIDKESSGTEKQTYLLYDKLAGIGATDTFHFLETGALFFDDNGNSHTQIGGVPVYCDGSHINTLYSASAGEYFTEELKKLLLP
jgi:hypothetical protein